jgi:RecA/RadA recombinase
MTPKEAERHLRHKRAVVQLGPKDFLNSGSTMLNMATTGHPYRCFAKGFYYLVIGDSDAGKSVLLLTTFAEAAKNKNFAEHRFIFDAVERGALMDLTRFFGKKMAERLEAPAYDDNEPVYSETIEDFQYHLDDALQAGKPFIYVLDSVDALDAKEDQQKFEAEKKAARKGTKAAGTYGTKAKKNAQMFRRVTGRLAKTGSILIIINQTRDNIGYGSQYNPKTRSGGRAMVFFATLQIWLSVVKKLTKKVTAKRKAHIGILSKVQVKRSRITGKDRTVYVPIYPSFGLDDTGSCVDFLVANEHWKKKGGKIIATGVNLVASREQLIQKIESGNLEDDLKQVVKECWDDMESRLEVRRKPRYE